MTQLLAALVGALFMAGFARADEGGPVKLEVSPKTVSMAPGGSATIRVHVRIESPFHIYTPEAQVAADGTGPTPTQLTVETKDLAVLEGPLKVSPGVRHFDANFGMDVDTLEGDAWLETAIKAGANVKPGNYRVVLGVIYQACSDTNCLMPKDVEAAFDLEIGAPPQAAAGSKAGG